MKKPQLALLFATCMFVLSACGGGGSSSGSPQPVAQGSGGSGTNNTNNTVKQTSPTFVAANLQTSVPALTYAPTSQEYAYVSGVNDFRSKLGLGLLAQSDALDKASQNHTSYLVAHPELDLTATNPDGSLVFHTENPMLSGFTGVMAQNRAAFTNYGSNSVGEEGTLGVPTAKENLAGLIDTVFHRELLMNQSVRDIGTSLVFSAKYSSIFVNASGYKTPQNNASDYIVVYPYDGQVNVDAAMRDEIPRPFTDVNGTNVTTTTSAPVSISSVAGSTITANVFTITEAGQTIPLSMRVVNNNTSPAQIGNNSIYLVGQAPFKFNTKYNVVFNGTVNGVNVTKNWSFTVGSTTYSM